MASVHPPPHQKARHTPYQGTTIERQAVPDEKVSWEVAFPEYQPPIHNAKSIQGQPWADKSGNLPTIPFNDMDREAKVNRKSHEGTYEVDPESGRPRNPRGRTGLRGRGLLGRFGPNHAADPVVARFKRDPQTGEVMVDQHGRPQWEFIAIQRVDTGEWAIPGGMVDPGEEVSLTLKREFGEETMNTPELSPEQRKEAEATIKGLFANGAEIYRGYSDDPRNTDWAWIETVAMLFFDESGALTAPFKLHAGDDAKGVKWTTYTPELKLFASHEHFLREADRRIVAKWSAL